MTFAAAPTPDRRLECSHSVEAIRGGPSRSNLRQHVELDGFAAAAGTDHGCSPEIVAFTGQIDTAPHEHIGKVFDALELPDKATPK